VRRAKANYPVRLVLVGDVEDMKRAASEAQRYGLIVTLVLDDSSSDSQIEGTLKQLSDMEHANVSSEASRTRCTVPRCDGTGSA
jgi:hypothetical protein